MLLKLYQKSFKLYKKIKYYVKRCVVELLKLILDVCLKNHQSTRYYIKRKRNYSYFIRINYDFTVQYLATEVYCSIRQK